MRGHLEPMFLIVLLLRMGCVNGEGVVQATIGHAVGIRHHVVMLAITGGHVQEVIDVTTIALRAVCVATTIALQGPCDVATQGSIALGGVVRVGGIQYLALALGVQDIKLMGVLLPAIVHPLVRMELNGIALQIVHVGLSGIALQVVHVEHVVPTMEVAARGVRLDGAHVQDTGILVQGL